MKYQCNSCGKIFDYRQDAVDCHPDINEIPDEELESGLASQQVVQTDGADTVREYVGWDIQCRHYERWVF